MTKLDDMILRFKSVHTNVQITTPQSNEIDLDLPKGFGARIRDVTFQHVTLWEELAGAAGMHEVQCALVNDPDDEVTVEIPHETVEHDVIDEYNTTHLNGGTGVATAFESNARQFRRFTEDEDVFAVRNLRFNAIALSGNQLSDVICIIDYTLEKVTSTELLAMLRIV